MQMRAKLPEEQGKLMNPGCQVSRHWATILNQIHELDFSGSAHGPRPRRAHINR
jgi:hypothetical protein